MSQIVITRIALVALLCAIAVLASWLMPRVLAKPDPFVVAMQLIENDRGEEAVFLLPTNGWRGVAQYRAQRYQRSLREFVREETVDNIYNMGNAYAHLHEWAGARSAYLRTLRLDPTHADAQYNLDVIERAAEAEERLKDEMRTERQLGNWKDGDRKDDERGQQNSDQVEDSGADKGAFKKSQKNASESGQSEMSGRLGDKPVSDGKFSGAAGGDALGDPPKGLTTGAGRALILRESVQSAEALLRQIRDEPKRVLAARLRNAHKIRTEEAGSCSGC